MAPRAEADGNSCERSDTRFGAGHDEAPAIVPPGVRPRPAIRTLASGSFGGSFGQHFSLAPSYHLECLYLAAQSTPRHVVIFSGLTNRSHRGSVSVGSIYCGPCSPRYRTDMRLAISTQRPPRFGSSRTVASPFTSTRLL